MPSKSPRRRSAGRPAEIALSTTSAQFAVDIAAPESWRRASSPPLSPRRAASAAEASRTTRAFNLALALGFVPPFREQLGNQVALTRGFAELAAQPLENRERRLEYESPALYPGVEGIALAKP
jgi:hypothetical protein